MAAHSALDLQTKQISAAKSNGDTLSAHTNPKQLNTHKVDVPPPALILYC